MINDARLISKTTQPILCCIGQSVATSPTQFLMERAIAATQLDWRAITVEVDPHDLAAAVAGMTAMKFMAVRFLPWLETSALELMGHSSTQLRFVGGATSAKRGVEGWRYWHHWGWAILHWAQQQVDLRHTLCWLHGDSVRCRSMFVALQQLAQQQLNRQQPSSLPSMEPSILPTVVLWTEPAADIPPELTPDQSDGAPLDMRIVRAEGTQGANYSELMSSLALQHNTSCLLFVGDQLPLSQLELPLGAKRSLVAGGKTAIKQAEACRLPQMSILGEAEQTVQCEAYDFHRWTGHHINPCVLQDAYDEYCDF